MSSRAIPGETTTGRALVSWRAMAWGIPLSASRNIFPNNPNRTSHTFSLLSVNNLFITIQASLNKTSNNRSPSLMYACVTPELISFISIFNLNTIYHKIISIRKGHNIFTQCSLPSKIFPKLSSFYQLQSNKFTTSTPKANVRDTKFSYPPDFPF